MSEGLRILFGARRLINAAVLLGVLAAVALLCALFFMLVRPSTASLSVRAVTEFLSAENVCADTQIDLLLPPGLIRTLSPSSDDAKPSVREELFDRPLLLHINGPHLMTVRRRGQTALRITIGPPESMTIDDRNRWSFVAVGDGPQEGGRTVAEAPEQLLYIANDAIDADFTVLLEGRVVFGEHVQASYGEVTPMVPDTGYVLREGVIRVGVKDWFDSARRIELPKHDLDPGDVVDTSDEIADAPKGDDACRQARPRGFFRKHHEGALAAIVSMEQNHVTVIRSTALRMGGSAVQKISSQPIIELSWQLALILVAAINFIGVLMNIGEIRRGAKRDAVNGSSRRRWGKHR